MKTLNRWRIIVSAVLRLFYRLRLLQIAVIKVGSYLQGDRYEILQVLGQGGMGAVLLATAHNLAQKKVVIKQLTFLNTNLTLEDQVRYFKHEVSSLSHLDHPLIPKIYDSFKENNFFFIVMEYIEGDNLEKILSLGSGSIEEDRVLAHASEVLNILECLARSQPPITHRDIKPANIIISAKHRRANLVDFGIARPNSANGQSRPMGTHGYAPPEQYDGNADTRSDLYALAATMHHLLTGRNPRYTPFDFPPARDFNPNLSPKIEQILTRALDIAPERRYQSASEMKQDIDDLLQNGFGQSSYQSNLTPAGIVPASSSPQNNPTPPPSQSQKGHSRLLLIVSISVILLLGSIWSINFFTIDREKIRINSGTTSISLPACICTVQKNGESIGISDGRYIFDTSSSSTDSKEQAAQKLREGDIGSALSRLSEAHYQDTSDAETLIYRENLRITKGKSITEEQKIMTLVVGTTLSGDFSLLATGHNNLQGAYIAQRQYNDTAEQHGGVRVRVLIANSGSKKEYVSLVADQITRLAGNDKTIVAVTGWNLTALTFEAIRELEKAHIPMTSYAGGDNLTSISKFLFRIGPPAGEQGKVGAHYAIDTLKAKTAVVLADDGDDYSRSLADGFRTIFTNNGNTITDNISYTVGDPAKNPQRLVTTVKRYHPDIIYFAGYPADTSILLEQIQPSDPLILGGDALYQPSGYTKKVSSNGLSHLRFTAFAYPDQWEILGLSAQKPTFFKDYRDAFGDGKSELRYGINRMDSGTMLSYDSTRALLEAINHILKKKYPITSNDIQAELPALTGPNAFNGATGQISFGVNANLPSDKAITIVCNKGGFFKLDVVVGRFVLNGLMLTDYPAASACA